MANPFTPEQISQILEEFFKAVGTRQYIGARYVPIFGRKGEESIEWDNSAPYEPLTIVLYQGNSYTSRQYVPVGVEITNHEFWALSGNYNAQIEQYRQEVLTLDGRISTNEDNIADLQTDLSDEIEARKLDIEKAHVFETVADMKASQNLSVGTICHTNGFHASGDGGAAWYEITDSGTANEMDVITCGDLFANLIITEDYVTPEMFGTYGDGTHNDTESINACFSENENIHFTENKTYFIDYINVKTDNTFIDGNGAILKFNSTRTGAIGDTINIYKTELISNRYRYKTEENLSCGIFSMKNVEINGNALAFSNYSDYSGTYTAFLMMQLFNYKTINIDNCYFHDTIQDAIWTNKTKQVNISNCIFNNIAGAQSVRNLSGCANAISIDSIQQNNTNACIKNNIFNHVWNECVRMDNFANFEFSNNTIVHCYQYGLELFFESNAYSFNAYINNNTINELRDCFINIDGNNSLATAEINLNISNNVIKDIGAQSFASENIPFNIFNGNVITASVANNIWNIELINNNISIRNFEIEQSAGSYVPINCRWCKLLMENNEITTAYLKSAYITANDATLINNKIISTYQQDLYSAVIATNELIAINNIFDAKYDRLVQFYTGPENKIVLNGNTIKSIISDHYIFDTDSNKTYPIIIFTNNIVTTARYLSNKGTITNLINTENIVKTNFLVPVSTTVVNKITDNNLLVL